MSRIVVTPEQLVDLKATFDREGGSVDELRSTLTSKLESVQWEGHNAETFRAEWHNTYAPMLNRLAESLRAAGQDVQTALNNALAADNQR